MAGRASMSDTAAANIPFIFINLFFINFSY